MDDPALVQPATQDAAGPVARTKRKRLAWLTGLAGAALTAALVVVALHAVGTWIDFDLNDTPEEYSAGAKSQMTPNLLVAMAAVSMSSVATVIGAAAAGAGRLRRWFLSALLVMCCAFLMGMWVQENQVQPLTPAQHMRTMTDAQLQEQLDAEVRVAGEKFALTEAELAQLGDLERAVLRTSGECFVERIGFVKTASSSERDQLVERLKHFQADDPTHRTWAQAETSSSIRFAPSVRYRDRDFGVRIGIADDDLVVAVSTDCLAPR